MNIPPHHSPPQAHPVSATGNTKVSREKTTAEGVEKTKVAPPPSPGGISRWPAHTVPAVQVHRHKSAAGTVHRYKLPVQLVPTVQTTGTSCTAGTTYRYIGYCRYKQLAHRVPRVRFTGTSRRVPPVPAVGTCTVPRYGLPVHRVSPVQAANTLLVHPVPPAGTSRTASTNYRYIGYRRYKLPTYRVPPIQTTGTGYRRYKQPVHTSAGVTSSRRPAKG